MQFTASAGLRDKLERLQALMRDADPDVDLAGVVEAAVTEKLERLEYNHHDRPFGRGGDHDPGGLRLMCKAHNRLLAERDYGKTLMVRHARAPARRC